MIGCTLDAISGAAHYVVREYGDHGYRIAMLTGTLVGGGIFEVSHGDGSRFQIKSDRYGNVERMPEAVVA